MTMTAVRPGAIRVLALEENEAWLEYLEATRTQSPLRYEEVEPWAWNRLCMRLKAIHARRLAIVGDERA